MTLIADKQCPIRAPRKRDAPLYDGAQLTWEPNPMNDQNQHRIEPVLDKSKRDAQGADRDQKQQGGANNASQHVQGEQQKPKTEQASHQGGGGVRSDHKPQGTGTQK
jgi:hypothetical protein